MCVTLHEAHEVEEVSAKLKNGLFRTISTLYQFVERLSLGTTPTSTF